MIDSDLIHLFYQLFVEVLIIDSYLIHLLSAIFRHVLIIETDLIHLLSAICSHMDHETTMFSVTALVTNTLETNLDTIGEWAQSCQLENIFGTYVSA